MKGEETKVLFSVPAKEPWENVWYLLQRLRLLLLLVATLCSSDLVPLPPPLPLLNLLRRYLKSGPKVSPQPVEM